MGGLAFMDDYRPKPVTPTALKRADMPHNATIEAAVLDALINLPITLAERRAACAYYTPDHFHIEANRIVFDAVAQMAGEDIPVDAATVAARLADKPAPSVRDGWVGYLRDTLTDLGGQSIEARREHAKILDNLRRCRAVIEQCDAVVASAIKSPDATALIEDATAKLTGIAATRTGTARSLADIAHDVFTRISSPERRPCTRFRKLDKAIGRLLGGQVTVIPARPKAGKTNLAWHIAEKIATTPRDEDVGPEGVFFVTAEMSAEALYYRQLGIRARVPPDLIQDGALDDHHWRRLTEASQGWSSLPVILDDFGGARPSIAKIEATFTSIRDRLASGSYRNRFGHEMPKCPMRVMVIDHLGKIASPRDSDRNAGDPQRLKASMEGVVDLAKRTDSHIFLLWHAGMGDKDATADLTPADIRGTKDPEGSCDRIVFLTRPEKNRIKLVHYVDRHRNALGSEDPIWLETENGAIWEANDAA